MEAAVAYAKHVGPPSGPPEVEVTEVDGLQLHLSSKNSTGYLGVVVDKGHFKAHHAENGKHFHLVLKGGGTLVDPVKHLWEMENHGPVPTGERAGTPLSRTRHRRKAAAMTATEVRAMVKALMRV